MDALSADLKSMMKEMCDCLGKKIQFNYPTASTVYDVLDDISHTENDGKINIVVACKSGDKVYYNDVDEINYEVLGHITKIWIKQRTDSEPRRITCFFVDEK